jgi:hypothetical protein
MRSPVPAVDAPNRTTKRWTAVAAIALTGLAFSGCRLVSTTAASLPKTSEIVHINATPQGCAPQPSEVRAGDVEFIVHNLDAPTVSEVEVRSANLADVFGEQENLIEGTTGRFSATLPKGRSVVDCPGALKSRWALTTTGTDLRRLSGS